jgi:hypothetical protein
MGLGKTSNLHVNHPVQVTTQVVDVASQIQVVCCAVETVEAHGGVHLLLLRQQNMRIFHDAKPTEGSLK